MKKNNKKFFSKNTFAICLLIIFVVAAGGYFYHFHMQKIQKLNSTLAEVRKKLGDSTSEINKLQENLVILENQKEQLLKSLQSERERNDRMAGQIEKMQKAVDTFEKLSSIDEEILKKYSKTYFLSEHYVPSSLSLIEKKYLYYEDEPEQIHSKVKPYLTDMIEAAKREGIELYVRSGYRSFGTQSKLKSKYNMIYGYGTANDFSAAQGYSEHQLGTTVDLITTGIGGTLAGFGKTEAFEWLESNAHKYGFTLSYPKDNKYYTYEPWHWRFVGEKLATHLHDNNMHFYDMEQREIDEYLVSVFD